MPAPAEMVWLPNPPRGTQITAGFDGSEYEDWTALKCVTRGGRLFTPRYGPDRRPTIWDPAEWGGQIPRAEVDHWIDLEPELVAHLTAVAHEIGKAQQSVVECERIGLMIAGFEVPHTHLHVVPLSSMANLDFRNADTRPVAAALDAMADSLRAALRSAGHSDQVPA